MHGFFGVLRSKRMREGHVCGIGNKTVLINLCFSQVNRALCARVGRSVSDMVWYRAVIRVTFSIASGYLLSIHLMACITLYLNPLDHLPSRVVFCRIAKCVKISSKYFLLKEQKMESELCCRSFSASSDLGFQLCWHLLLARMYNGHSAAARTTTSPSNAD